MRSWVLRGWNPETEKFVLGCSTDGCEGEAEVDPYEAMLNVVLSCPECDGEEAPVRS